MQKLINCHYCGRAGARANHLLGFCEKSEKLINSHYCGRAGARANPLLGFCDSSETHDIVMMVKHFMFLSFFPLIAAKQFQAWYLPADKLARYPNHPQIKTNEDVYKGFTLKKKLFSGKEYEEGVNIRDTS